MRLYHLDVKNRETNKKSRHKINFLYAKFLHNWTFKWFYISDLSYFLCISKAAPTIQVTVRFVWGFFFGGGGVFKDTTDESPLNACSCSFLTLDDIPRAILKKAVICLYLLVSSCVICSPRILAGRHKKGNNFGARIFEIVYSC